MTQSGECTTTDTLAQGWADGLEDDTTALLERLRELDARALEVIHDRYYPRIYRYVCRRLGPMRTLSEQMTAEDLTAEVFMRMIKAIRDRKAWKSHFDGWLYRIAHNLVADHFRRRARNPRVSLEDAPPLVAIEGDPVQIVESRVDQQQLSLAMRCLTDDQAEVMCLRFLEGLSISEVASIMNRTEGSVKGLQYRGAVALRRLLVSPTELASATEFEPGDRSAGARDWSGRTVVAPAT